MSETTKRVRVIYVPKTNWTLFFLYLLLSLEVLAITIIGAILPEPITWEFSLFGRVVGTLTLVTGSLRWANTVIVGFGVMILLAYILLDRWSIKRYACHLRSNDTGIELWTGWHSPNSEHSIITHLSDSENKAGSSPVPTLVLLGNPPLGLPNTDTTDYRNEALIARAHRETSSLLILAAIVFLVGFGSVLVDLAEQGSLSAIFSVSSMLSRLYLRLLVVAGILAIVLLYLARYGHVFLRIMPGRIQVVRSKFWKDDVTISDFEINSELLLLQSEVSPSFRTQLTMIKRGSTESGACERVTLRKKDIPELYRCVFSSVTTPLEQVPVDSLSVS